MSFLDNLSKKISHGIDRAKFEADKFQKASSLQNDITELRKQVDTRRLEFGDRALELFRAGKIQSPTLAEILKAMEAIQVQVTLKEEELKITQAEVFVEPPPVAAPPPAQQVPISVAPPQAAPEPAGKTCPNCAFHMPVTAMFCPNCGSRVGV